MELQTIIDMKKTLDELHLRLTPYSGKAEHQRYLDTLCHYQKIVNVQLSRINDNINKTINIYNDKIRSMEIDNDKIKTQILDGQQ
jgi:hypothetical protein